MIMRQHWGEWKPKVGEDGMLHLVIKPIQGSDYQYSVPVRELIPGPKKWEWIDRVKGMDWRHPKKMRKIVRDLRRAIVDLYER